MSDDIPTINRGASTGKAQVFVLDNKRQTIPIAYLCLDCKTKYLAYMPDVPNLSSYLTCEECQSRDIILAAGLDIDDLEELHFELSPTVRRRRR